MSTAADGSDSPVRIEVSVEHRGGRDADVVECPRADWEAMTPDERVDWCEEAAVAHQTNVAPAGWHVLGDVAGSDENQP